MIKLKKVLTTTILSDFSSKYSACTVNKACPDFRSGAHEHGSVFNWVKHSANGPKQ